VTLISAGRTEEVKRRCREHLGTCHAELRGPDDTSGCHLAPATNFSVCVDFCHRRIIKSLPSPLAWPVWLVQAGIKFAQDAQAFHRHCCASPCLLGIMISQEKSTCAVPAMQSVAQMVMHSSMILGEYLSSYSAPMRYLDASGKLKLEKGRPMNQRKSNRSNQIIDIPEIVGTPEFRVFKFTLLALFTILCSGLIVFSAIEMWHFLRVWASTL
jgi:hypothetical protein